MPLYEYLCLDCERRFERLRSASASDGAACDCGSDHTRRLISLFAAHSKGNGGGKSLGGGGCGSCGGGHCSSCSCH
jgi:putative FmdB family regulatory protein